VKGVLRKADQKRGGSRDLIRSNMAIQGKYMTEGGPSPERLIPIHASPSLQWEEEREVDIGTRRKIWGAS